MCTASSRVSTGSWCQVCIHYIACLPCPCWSPLVRLEHPSGPAYMYKNARFFSSRRRHACSLIGSPSGGIETFMPVVVLPLASCKACNSMSICQMMRRAGRQKQASSSVAGPQGRIAADSSAGRMSSDQSSSDEPADGMHAKLFPSQRLCLLRDKSRKRTLVSYSACSRAGTVQYWAVAVIRRARGFAAVQNGARARARDGSA